MTINLIKNPNNQLIKRTLKANNMKMTFLLFVFSIFFTANMFSQAEIYQPVNLLEKIEYLSSLKTALKIVNEKEIKEPLPLNRQSISDSLVIQYRTFILQSNSVRLDPDKVKLVFPEVITTRDDYNEVDYISLVPILLEAIGNQQEIIRQLNDRINQLESTVSE